MCLETDKRMRKFVKCLFSQNTVHQLYIFIDITIVTFVFSFQVLASMVTSMPLWMANLISSLKCFVKSGTCIASACHRTCDRI